MYCFKIINLSLIFYIFFNFCSTNKADITSEYINKNKEGDMNSDLLKIIKGRRSIRSFKSKSIPDNFVDKIMEACIWSPSAGNGQPWSFYHVYNKEIKQKLAVAASGQNFIIEAPLVIVVCADIEKAENNYGTRGKSLYMFQDTAACIQNILLESHSLGLGTCWIGAFREEVVVKTLNIPSNLRPIALIPVGYTDENPQPPPRNQWQNLTKIIE